MNILDRILLTIYMLVMVFVSICIIIIPFNILTPNVIQSFIVEHYSKWSYSLIGVLLLFLSIRLLLSGIRFNKKSKRGVIKTGELGDIKISVETFESLSLKIVKDIPGIKDVKVMVEIQNNGTIIIHTRLLVLPDINIPKVVGEVQNKIKGYIESITEITVSEVKVIVDNITSASSVRVQ